MPLTLTITSIVVLVGLALLGAWRGVVPGLLALLGTLVGALLAEIWAPAWSAWLVQRTQILSPASMLWSITTLSFLLSVLLVGYAGASLLPQPKTNTAAPRPKSTGRADMLARAAGALLGLFEGVLLMGFLLRYSVELLKSESFTAAVRASLPARLLYQGLGWAFLAPALLILAALLVRLVVRFARSMAARQRAARSAPPVTPAVAAAPAKSAPAAPATPAAAARPAPADPQTTQTKVQG